MKLFNIRHAIVNISVCLLCMSVTLRPLPWVLKYVERRLIVGYRIAEIAELRGLHFLKLLLFATIVIIWILNKKGSIYTI